MSLEFLSIATDKLTRTEFNVATFNAWEPRAPNCEAYLSRAWETRVPVSLYFLLSRSNFTFQNFRNLIWCTADSNVPQEHFVANWRTSNLSRMRGFDFVYQESRGCRCSSSYIEYSSLEIPIDLSSFSYYLFVSRDFTIVVITDNWKLRDFYTVQRDSKIQSLIWSKILRGDLSRKSNKKKKRNSCGKIRLDWSVAEGKWKTWIMENYVGKKRETCCLRRTAELWYNLPPRLATGLIASPKRDSMEKLLREETSLLQPFL